jgi:hypothetical protein
MLPLLTLASFFGLADTLGLGDNADAVFHCTDPAFFVVRNENPLTGDTHLELKGTLNAPQQGYSTRFQFVTVEGNQAYAILSAGQKIGQDKRFGRGLPEIQPLQVDQKFNVPQGVTTLRVRVEGLSAQPTEFMCDITQAPNS